MHLFSLPQPLFYLFSFTFNHFLSPSFLVFLNTLAFPPLTLPPPRCPYKTLTECCPTLDTHLDSLHIQKHCGESSLGVLRLSIRPTPSLRCCIDAGSQQIKTHFLCNVICKFSVTPFLYSPECNPSLKNAFCCRLLSASIPLWLEWMMQRKHLRSEGIIK